MRKIQFETIVDTVKQLFLEAGKYLPEDVCVAFENSLKIEESERGKAVLNQLIENQKIARNEEMPLCQDTGFAVVFVEWGQSAVLENGVLIDAVNEGVRRAYIEGYYRKSIVNDPIFNRKNTGDNTPCILHLDFVEGDKVKIIAAPKGGGSENMSAIKLLKPADGVEGVKNFVFETVEKAGGNPCPPIIVGVGVGGTMEKAAYLSKKSLLRHIGEHNPNELYSNLEKELLENINKLGIGPMGFGGRVTALAVNVEYHPCHIASMPVAVNIQCHSARHKEKVI